MILTNAVQFFKYKCRDKNVFQANEICKCKVPFHIPNQNFCSTLMKMMRSGMYIRNSNRSDNRKRTYLYILQLILRAFKLQFVNGSLLDFFSHSFKGTIMQVEKAQMNYRLRASNFPEHFAIQLFIILQ